MRSDMSKVIVERPRRHYSYPAYPRGHLENRWAPDWENAPRIESMGSVYGTKWLNENLQPLVRFLRSSEGRPWDSVHSEISERLSVKSAVQKHVLDHLRDYVSENVFIDGKTVMVFDRTAGLRALQSRGSWLRFYIHPRTRLLRLAPQVPRKRQERETAPDRRVLSHEEELRRLNGVWYAIRLSPIPHELEARACCFDVLERTHLIGSTFEASKNELWKSGRYAASKVQLGKRQIARYGLSQS